MPKDKLQKELYKAEGERRMKIRKQKRLNHFKNDKGYPGSRRYERSVEMGLVQTCEWGSRRCDLLGCNGDC